MEELIDLKLHEQLSLDDCTEIVRVPNGWIYKFYQEMYDKENRGEWLKLISTTFVPEK